MISEMLILEFNGRWFQGSFNLFSCENQALKFYTFNFKVLQRFDPYADTPPPPVTTPPEIKSTAGKLWNHIFSAGIKNIMTFSAFMADGTCIIFDGETKITMGKQQKQGRESALNTNLAGKHIFLAGRPFTLAGQRFSGVVIGGCLLATMHDGCPTVFSSMVWTVHDVSTNIVTVVESLTNPCGLWAAFV